MQLCTTKHSTVIFFLLYFLLSTVVHASEQTTYNLTIESVYDGDTIKGYVDIWPNLTKYTSIRINGIDTPELRTKNKCEKALGLKAKQALIDLIGDKQVTISNVRLGKYAGRVLADVSVSGKDVAAYMIKHGYAREYHGGKRAGWCASDD